MSRSIQNNINMLTVFSSIYVHCRSEILNAKLQNVRPNFQSIYIYITILHTITSNSISHLPPSYFDRMVIKYHSHSCHSCHIRVYFFFFPFFPLPPFLLLAPSSSSPWAALALFLPSGVLEYHVWEGKTIQTQYSTSELKWMLFSMAGGFTTNLHYYFHVNYTLLVDILYNAATRLNTSCASTGSF